MKTIQLTCTKCHGTMKVDNNGKTFFCPYCGATILAIESDSVKIAKIEHDTIKEIELGKQELKRYKARSENKPIIAYIGFSAAMIFMIFLFVYLIPTIKGEIKAPSPSVVYVNQNYETVLQQFQDAGFEDVETIPLGDLSNSFLRNREGDIGKIQEISINGITKFDSDNWFPKNAKVRIYYHTFPDRK